MFPEASAKDLAVKGIICFWLLGLLWRFDWDMSDDTR